MSEPSRLPTAGIGIGPSRGEDPPDASLERFDRLVERVDRLLTAIEKPASPPKASGGDGGNTGAKQGYALNAVIVLLLIFIYAAYHEHFGAQSNAAEIAVAKRENEELDDELKELRKEVKELRARVDKQEHASHDRCP